MKPRNWWNIENQTDTETKDKATTLFLKDAYNILSKGITLSDNVKGVLLEVEFTVANTEVKIRHGLDFVPTNYLLCGSDVALSIYDGATAADKTYFYLRSSAAGNARVFIF